MQEIREKVVLQSGRIGLRALMWMAFTCMCMKCCCVAVNMVGLWQTKSLTWGFCHFCWLCSQNEGIILDPSIVDSVDSVWNFPKPKDLTSLRLFLGLIWSCYRTHVAWFAWLDCPDEAVLAFLWMDEINAEFKKCKEILCEPLVVFLFNPSLKTELLTDTRNLYGLGWVLAAWCGRQNENCSLCTEWCTEWICCYFSQKLWLSIRAFAYYLLGAELFTVVTDHRLLVGIIGKNMGILKILTSLYYDRMLLPTTFWLTGHLHLEKFTLLLTCFIGTLCLHQRWRSRV